ncbi:hypothetical protein J3R30DRAFT_3703129 [Lentinula aciculospora]|uniref:Uncharacterized protein n=1 Tax=Lentinula aciculospora TaxID=153920 RepID=A0A9W9ADE2_9AGAR|nr:hypothetical protein J3R30DRAFT_3703129 [Lentinula aciculospora]
MVHTRSVLAAVIGAGGISFALALPIQEPSESIAPAVPVLPSVTPIPPTMNLGQSPDVNHQSLIIVEEGADNEEEHHWRHDIKVVLVHAPVGVPSSEHLELEISDRNPMGTPSYKDQEVTLSIDVNRSSGGLIRRAKGTEHEGTELIESLPVDYFDKEGKIHTIKLPAARCLEIGQIDQLKNYLYFLCKYKSNGTVLGEHDLPLINEHIKKLRTNTVQWHHPAYSA